MTDNVLLEKVYIYITSLFRLLMAFKININTLIMAICITDV